MWVTVIVSWTMVEKSAKEVLPQCAHLPCWWDILRPEQKKKKNTLRCEGRSRSVPFDSRQGWPFHRNTRRISFSPKRGGVKRVLCLVGEFGRGAEWQQAVRAEVDVRQIPDGECICNCQQIAVPEMVRQIRMGCCNSAGACDVQHHHNSSLNTGINRVTGKAGFLWVWRSVSWPERVSLYVQEAVSIRPTCKSKHVTRSQGHSMTSVFKNDLSSAKSDVEARETQPPEAGVLFSGSNISLHAQVCLNMVDGGLRRVPSRTLGRRGVRTSPLYNVQKEIDGPGR